MCSANSVLLPLMAAEDKRDVIFKQVGPVLGRGWNLGLGSSGYISTSCLIKQGNDLKAFEGWGSNSVIIRVNPFI